MPAPKRILVYGVTGSGKSVLASRIANAVGLPLHLVDEEVGWLPGLGSTLGTGKAWQLRPEAEQRRIVERICAEDRWVLDTAYGAWRDVPLARAEVVVALDYPRWVSLTRLIGRTARRLRTRELTCNGNVETWAEVVSNDSIVVWHFRSFRRKRRRIREWMAEPTRPAVVHLRTPRETQRWLRLIAHRD